MNPGIKLPLTLLLSLIEATIAKLLRFDPAVRESVGDMAGKVVAVELREPLDMIIYALPERETLRLTLDHAGEVHLRIRGTPLALMAMAMAPDKRASALAGDIEIIGDLALSHQVQACLAALDIDWEEVLSYYLGDIPAHQLGRAYRTSASWLEQSRETLELDLTEYLKTETAILPDQDDVNGFIEAVDRLRTDVDRLEARLKRLERQLVRLP